MKKVFIIVLIFVLLFTVSACSTKNYNDKTTNVSNQKNNESLESSDTLKNNNNIEYTNITSQIIYMSFEETLASATNIVIATYTGEMEKCGIYYDLVFSPERQIKGSGVDKDFHVRVCNQSVTVSDKNIQYVESVEKYTKNKKYVLILEKQVSVYDAYDLYLPLNNVLIEEGKNPTMYDCSALSNFSDELKDIIDFNSAIEYINDFQLKGIDTSKIVGTDFIRSDNLSEVVNKSSIVAEVTAVELTAKSENNNTERYICSVQNVLKGDISKSDIKIIFMAGTVEIGKKYTVLIERLGTSEYYILSSKISVYDSQDKASEQVKIIIKDSGIAK